MPQIHTPSGKPTSALLMLVLATLALAACGSSSNSSSTGSSTSATTTAAASSSPNSSSTTGRSGAFRARTSALRECLKKHGITLPQRKPGQRTGAPFTSATLPAGVTRSQYEAAFKACGGFPHVTGTGGAFRSPQAHQALAKFAACMSEHGVKLPKANTASGGPIFNVKGVNTSSPTFKAAEANCRSDLSGLFRGRPGAPPSGAPPSSG